MLKFDFNQAADHDPGPGRGAHPEQLYRLADERIRNRLETQSGVGQVSIFGGQQREVQVEVGRPACGPSELTLQQVTQALGAENVDLPGARCEPGRNLNLRVDAKFRSPGTSRAPWSAPPQRGPGAGARRGHGGGRLQDQSLLSRVNGKDAVGITVTKQASANVTNTAACGRKSPASGSLRGELEVITDDSVFIRNSPHRSAAHLIEAVLLTGLVLLVFLHSWRSTVIVLLAIPTSLIATFGVMWLQGFTLNFLTTLALTLTIGILVDDSIVVLENIYRHLARARPRAWRRSTGRDRPRRHRHHPGGCGGLHPRGAHVRAGGAVLPPVRLHRGLRHPLLPALLLHPDPLAGLPLAEGGGRARARAPGAFGRWWERGFDRLTRVYERALRWTLRGRWLVVLGAVVALAVG